MTLRRPWFAFALLFSLIVTCAIAQQQPHATNQPTTQPPAGLIPIPADPLELATGQGRVLDTAQDRASVLSLLETARQNADLTAPAAGSFIMKTTCEASGALAHTGSGEMTELWISPSRWGWTTQFAGYSQQRVFIDGRIHDQRSETFVPLRLQMVRATLFWPMNFESQAMMRIAAGRIGSTDLLCALFSGRMNDPAAMSSIPGRRWVETEYCADPKTGLLRVYSETPGIYMGYEYDGDIQYHGKTVPRNITIPHAGNVVLNIRVESTSEPAPGDVALLNVASKMDAGPQTALSLPIRIPQSTTLPQGFKGEAHPVIVHATVGPDGQVLEEEALQTSDPALAQAALDAVRRSTYSNRFPRGGNAAGWQREYFINVRFPQPTEQSSVIARP
jgi:hypothetical protein